MAILDTLTQKVNILPTGIPTPVHLSQSENGRTLSFEIIGGSGELPAGSVVTLTGTKPDGVVYSAVGTLSGNIATFEEDVQLTAAAGVWPAKIEVTNGGHMIATGRISFTIDADPVAPGSVPSESELDGLVAQAAMYAENARSAAYGSPLTAATAADMIDTTRVYVYTGNETGMDNGHWYYWEDGAWKDGGIYNAAAVQTDTSLSIPGMAADAKATGEAIAAEATAREQADTDLKADIKYIAPTISWTADKYIDGTGLVQSGTGRSLSNFVPCLEGETIKYIAETNHANVCGISFWDSEQNFVSGDTNVGTIDTEQTATVPSGGCFARLSIKTNSPDQTETAYLKINRIAERDVFISKFRNVLIKSVSFPSGFTWATNPLVNNLYKVGEEYVADLDVADYKPKGTRYYVNPINGNDEANGKLVAYPLKTIQAAYSKSDVAEICLYPGYYYLSNRFTNTQKNIAFTTVANTRAKFVCGKKMTWTQLEGYSKIWQATLNNAKTVVSDVIKGDTKYSLVDNWASMESTENTYRCTTYTVFVHSDGEPSEDVMVLQRQLNGTFRFGTDGVAYVENIDFIGGIGGACEIRNTDQNAEADVRFYAKNCTFAFGTTTDGFSAGNGLRATGCNEIIIQDCEAKYNTDDGFNYHIDYSGQECNAIEINCVAHDNGISGGTDNGSTIHDGAKMIRVNTECYNNNGPNIADVNDGTQSVNYGCICKNSGVNVNYNAQDGTAEMWLYNCDAAESLYAISVGINSASTVHVSGGNLDGLLQYGNTAVIDTM